MSAKWDAATKRVIQEAAARGAEEHLSGTEFQQGLAAKIAEGVTEELIMHPETKNAIKTEIEKVAEREKLGLTAIVDKSKFVRNWILFLAGVGVGSYALVTIVGWLFRLPGNKQKK